MKQITPDCGQVGEFDIHNFQELHYETKETEANEEKEPTPLPKVKGAIKSKFTNRHSSGSTLGGFDQLQRACSNPTPVNQMSTYGLF